MLFRNKVSTVIISLVLGFGFVACTDDQKPEEAVTPTSGEEAAVAPADTGAGLSGDTVYFAFDDYSLNDESKGKLNGLGDKLKGSAGSVIQIEGHCDERGSIEYNLALGERRAQSVKNYLVQLGVDPARLTTISYGEERPAADGHDEAAWNKNRRAEFVISKQ